MNTPDLSVNRSIAAFQPSLERKQHTVKLGALVFSISEAMFLCGLIGVFLVFRNWYPEVFQSGSRMLGDKFAALATLFLVTSSFTMALGTNCLTSWQRDTRVIHLFLTAVCAALFLAIRYFEYSRNMPTGVLWSTAFASAGAEGIGASLFFNLYLLITGLHCIHVIIGTVLISKQIFCLLNSPEKEDHPISLEPAAMYWHMGVVVWIIMFPLLYLI